MGNNINYSPNRFAQDSPQKQNLQSLQKVVRTPHSRVVHIFVEEDIQFEVDVADPKNEKTCEWLRQEVSHRYALFLEYLSREEQLPHKYTSNGQHEMKQSSKRKRRFIVALKTEDFREGIDCWLNQKDRDLSVLKEGTRLVAHFAKINIQTRINWTQNREVTIEDFEQVRVVGRGGYSTVILARKKDTGRIYAIKMLRKDRLQGQIKVVQNEREILQKLDHPFLIKLLWAFQNQQHLYFVMDICTGGEMFIHLVNLTQFSETTAKFFMCEILLGFKYLHERDIVFRDIKPENILIDLDGHVRIADFGLSKIIKEEELSNTICGSPEYLSPEMLQSGEGHDRRVDIYSLGVLLYEMLTGLPPFYDKDHQKMFVKIVKDDLVLDQPYMSAEVKDLLQNMLEKDPVMRFQSIKEVMEHRWFTGTDWNAYLQKKVKPLFIPDINQCYFENFSAEADGDDSLNLSQPNPRQSAYGSHFKSLQRRQSYYLHSTVNLHSNIDETTSFLRAPSPNIKLLEQSAITMFQGQSESYIDPAAHSCSYVDGGESHSNPHMAPPFILNVSRLNLKPSSSHLDSSYSPQRLAEYLNPFPDFYYAAPPLADSQILRYLENQLHKKRDQLQQSRDIKQMVLQHRNSKVTGQSQNHSASQNIDESLVDHQSSNYMQSKRFFQYTNGAAGLARSSTFKSQRCLENNSGLRLRRQNSPGLNKSSTLVTVAEEYTSKDVEVGYRVLHKDEEKKEPQPQPPISQLTVREVTKLGGSDSRLSKCSPLLPSNSNDLQSLIRDIRSSQVKSNLNVDKSHQTIYSSFRTEQVRAEDPPSLDGSSKSTIKFVSASKERPHEDDKEQPSPTEEKIDCKNWPFQLTKEGYISASSSESLEGEEVKGGFDQNMTNQEGKDLSQKPLTSQFKKIFSNTCKAGSEVISNKNNDVAVISSHFTLGLQENEPQITEVNQGVGDEHRRNSPSLNLRKSTVKLMSFSKMGQSIESFPKRNDDQKTLSDAPKSTMMMISTLENGFHNRVGSGSNPHTSDQSDKLTAQKHVHIHVSDLQSIGTTLPGFQDPMLLECTPTFQQKMFEEDASIGTLHYSSGRRDEKRELSKAKTASEIQQINIQEQTKKQVVPKKAVKNYVNPQKAPAIKQFSLTGSFKGHKVVKSPPKVSNYLSQDSKTGEKMARTKDLTPPPISKFQSFSPKVLKQGKISPTKYQFKMPKMSSSFNRYFSPKPLQNRQSVEVSLNQVGKPRLGGGTGYRKKASSLSSLANDVSYEIARSQVADENESVQPPEKTLKSAVLKKAQVNSFGELMNKLCINSPRSKVNLSSFDQSSAQRDKTPKLAQMRKKTPSGWQKLPSPVGKQPHRGSFTGLPKKKSCHRKTPRESNLRQQSQQQAQKSCRSFVSLASPKNVLQSSPKTSEPQAIGQKHIKVRDLVLQAQNYSFQARKGMKTRQNQDNLDTRKINIDLPVSTIGSASGLTLAHQKSCGESTSIVQTPSKSATLNTLGSKKKKKVSQSFASVSTQKTKKVHHVTLSLAIQPRQSYRESQNSSRPNLEEDKFDSIEAIAPLGQKESDELSVYLMRGIARQASLDKDIVGKSPSKLAIQKVPSSAFSQSQKRMNKRNDFDASRSLKNDSNYSMFKQNPAIAFAKDSCGPYELQKINSSNVNCKSPIEDVKSVVKVTKQASHGCLNDRLMHLSRQVVVKGSASQRSNNQSSNRQQKSDQCNTYRHPN